MLSRKTNKISSQCFLNLVFLQVEESLLREYDERLTAMLKKDVQIREMQIASTSESPDVQ